MYGVSTTTRLYRGYNRVSMTAANRKFGRDIFKESAADAMWRMRPLMKGPR
jgi:hypothetical protein